MSCGSFNYDLYMNTVAVGVIKGFEKLLLGQAYRVSSSGITAKMDVFSNGQ